ncbi:MAG: hypothetical protein AMS26_19365, partial [Bacteroides sp. SM23_62]
MKKYASEKSLWQSLLSLFALGIFIILAAGSVSLPFPINQTLELHDNGDYEETLDYLNYVEITTGKRNKDGKWHGPVTIRRQYLLDVGSSSTEEVIME